MKINTALILCAGYGKRLNPITLTKPKPLLKIRDKCLLSQTIELIISLGIKDIKLNTFYLSDQIVNYVRSSPYKNQIEIINDGNKILDTGGGVKHMMKYSKSSDFIIFNPDTLWSGAYKNIILDMINLYEKQQYNNILLVVNKKKSFDKKLKGDFQLSANKLSKENINQYIYTGVQVINKDLLNNIKKKNFSMNTVWNEQINKLNLNGFESKNKFIHLTNIDIYNYFLKNY